MEWRQVELAVLQDRNVTVVEASWDGLAARGSAKREPGDRHVAGIGVNLATARALRRLAEQVEADARRMVDVCNPTSSAPPVDAVEALAAVVESVVKGIRSTLAAAAGSAASA